MKKFSRTFLPETIQYNGQTYFRNIAMSGAMNANRTPHSTIQGTLKLENRKCILVRVLGRNLKGKLDLHNKPYQPTEWIFTTENKSSIPLVGSPFEGTGTCGTAKDRQVRGKLIAFKREHDDATLEDLEGRIYAVSYKSLKEIAYNSVLSGIVRVNS